MCSTSFPAGSEIMDRPASRIARLAATDVLADIEARRATMVAGLRQVAIDAIEERRLIQELRKDLAERQNSTISSATR